MAAPASPYLVPGFYDRALANGKHRDIVGGRWDETGRIQMQILRDAGMQPHHHLLDIGAGSLRLGCKAVPYLDPGHYWATDASHALMLRGWETELPDPARLPVDHLWAEDDFSLSHAPAQIDYAIAFGVFTHLTADHLDRCLMSVAERLPNLRAFLFTTFLAPPEDLAAPYRQADGVVTHPDRPPYHRSQNSVGQAVERVGLIADFPAQRLPRGQALCIARPRQNSAPNHP